MSGFVSLSLVCLSLTGRQIWRRSALTATLLLSIIGTATAGTPTFPRIGSIWWGEQIFNASPTQAAQIKLYLAPNFTPAAAAAVKAANPSSLLLMTVNAMETTGGIPNPPSSYYLLDSHGNRIENWPGNPGNYLLNLTNPAVVQYMAQYAYQQMTQSGFKYDGIFFDNVEMTISTMTTDCCGHSIQINDNYPGPPDAAGALDAKWSAGLYNLLAAFKQLAPSALISVHANQLPPDPRSLAVANGDAFVFDVTNVREGQMAFGTLYNSYQQWFSSGQSPVITAIQSSPPNQIAYGYGYQPLTTAVPSTIAFGQNWYPNMRFGLGMALMNDGYSIFDLGDTSSPVTWWYDEYNFYLGAASAPAEQIGNPPGNSIIQNGYFSSGLSNWVLNVTSDGQAKASASTVNFGGSGGPAAQITVSSAATIPWHIEFQQSNLHFQAGQEYQLQFWADASTPTRVQVVTQSGTSPYPNYGLLGAISVGTKWAPYTISFVAPVTASDGILEFQLGAQTGTVWFDAIQLSTAPTEVYRRDFANGIALLNGTSSKQTISLESGFQRFMGPQAPRYQYIVDDTGSSFTTSGSWKVDTLDTGMRKSSGPYYHAWQSTLHELDSSSGSAQWSLNIPSQAHYTIQAWLPAAPAASTWTKSATYRVMSGSQVIATKTIDQSLARGGDQWFTLFTDLYLSPGSVLVLTNGSSSPMIADAIYLYTPEWLYNDGSATSSVTLAPYDAILLQRTTANQTISFDSLSSSLSSKSMGTSAFSVPATASSGLPVTVTSNTASVCTVSGSQLTVVAAGTCSLTARQKGNGSYTAAAPVTRTFNVLAP